jgi:hypothetical protein
LPKHNTSQSYPKVHNPQEKATLPSPHPNINY